MNGVCIGVVELSLFFVASFYIRNGNSNLKNMNVVSFYWLMMTILTGIWEFAFVVDYDRVVTNALDLLLNHKHIWFSDYDVLSILPWRLAKIFYAEYGAYADRDYMLLHNDWSRIIESTHALFCGLFAFLSIILKGRRKENKALVLIGVSMGAQLMNSILYMTTYFNQLLDPHSVNYNSVNFPVGFALSKRPFMYVNIFWTIMPSFVICMSLHRRHLEK